MKILFFGAINSTHSAKWVNSLTELGHQVMFVCSKTNEKQVDFSEKVIIHVLKYPGKLGYYLNVPEVKKIFREYKPDVVNVHYASGYGTLARLAKLRPLVLSCYGSDVFDYPFHNKFNMYNIRKNLKYADAIASTSHVMADKAKEILNDPNLKVTVTPFGVNIDKFKPMNVVHDKKYQIIGIVKYLEPIYDIPLLLKAFKIVCERAVVTPMLLIYGGGTLLPQLQMLAKKLGIEEYVSFKGTIPNNEVPEAINGMDVFVNCSIRESFGVALVETMACGIPVVATDTPGFREVVDNGKTGIILEDRQPETLARALLSLLNDEDLRKKYSAEGRKKVLQLYDWNKNLKLMEELYYSLLRK